MLRASLQTIGLTFMTDFFKQKHDQLLAAGKHADVCFLSEGTGWIALGSPEKMTKALFPPGLVSLKELTPNQLQVTVETCHMPSLIRVLQEHGKSVALLERWSPSTGIKPQPTLIVRIEPPQKINESEWI